MQLIANGPASPWFWGPLIPLAVLIAYRWVETKR